MTDILERLRAYIPGENDDYVPEAIASAADEIERFRLLSDHWAGVASKAIDEIERLRATLADMTKDRKSKAKERN